MWNKIKEAWKSAIDSIKGPWKDCWEAFKAGIVNVVACIALFVWGVIKLVFQALLAFVKSVGILLFNWLIEWIKRW